MMLLGKEKVPPPLGQWRKKKKKRRQHFSALFKLCCYPLKTEEAGTAMTRNATLHLFPFSHINHLLTHTNTCCERANTRCPPGTTQCNAAPSSASWHEMPCAGPSIGPSPAVWPDCNTQNLFISQSNPETLKISERFFLNTFQKTVKAQRKKKPTRPPITVKAAPKSIWVLQSHTLLVWPVLNSTAAEPNHQRHTDTHESSPGNFNQERSSPTALRGRVI